MEKCSNCGKTIFMKTCFGKEILCKKCDSLIGASNWNQRDFVSMEDLLEKRNHTIQVAE